MIYPNEAGFMENFKKEALSPIGKQDESWAQGDFEKNVMSAAFMGGSPILASSSGIMGYCSTRQHTDGICHSQPHPFSFGCGEDLEGISGLDCEFPSIEPSPLLSSSLIETFGSDKCPENMDLSELRSKLDETLVENASLKSQIQTASRQLNKAKLQVTALLNLELSEVATNQSHHVSNILDENNSERPPDIDSGVDTAVDADLQDIHEVPLHILPANTFVFIRHISEITSRIEVSQVREHMLEGLHITNQLVLGGLTGWASAYLVKNFGKSALIALGGGCFILGLANYKGYVEINWNEIYQEIQRKNEQISQLNEPDWTTEKIRNAKEWFSSHSITVGGFVGGFLYNII